MFDFVKEHVNAATNIKLAIEQLESKYGIHFPKLLKQYYESFDGCKMNVCVFHVDGYECEVSRMIPICGHDITFEHIADNNRSDGFLNPNYFPLAANRGGDYYYWDSASGKIYLVLSDDIENPFEICDSIDAFFAILDAAKKK